MAKGEGWGGNRRGAGRKPNAVVYKQEITKATDILGRMLPEAALAVRDLALGARVIMVPRADGLGWEKPASDAQMRAAIERGEGAFLVYRELPDIKALALMFERVAGKVPQPIDVRHQLAIEHVTEAQTILMRVLEEHVPAEYLAPVRAELARVADLHSEARTAVGVA
jgi:hypothetical protein